VVAYGADGTGDYELKWEHVVDDTKIFVDTMAAVSTAEVLTKGGYTWTNQFIYWVETDKSGAYSFDNRVFALEQQQFTTGTIVTNEAWSWYFPGGEDEDPVGHLTVASDNTIYVIGKDGSTYTLYCLDGNDGSQNWSMNLGFTATSNPSLATDGTLYVPYNSGIKAVNPSNQTVAWTHSATNAVYNPPVVGVDGSIYFTFDNSSNGFLRRIESNGDTVSTDFFEDYPFEFSPLVMDRKGWLFVCGRDTDSNYIYGDGKMFAIQGAGRPAFSDWPMWGRGYSHNSRAGKTWRAIDLGDLGGFGSNARGVNQDNLVVGLAANGSSYTKAAYATDHTWTDIYSSINANFAAYGVNDGGHIVGYRSDTSPYKGFRWLDDTDKQDLNGLSGSTYALAINNSQRIVGWSLNSYPTFRGVMWNSGSSTATDIESLSGSGSQYASIAYAVASSGRIAGGSVDSSSYFRAFLTDTTGIIDEFNDNLGTLGGNNSYAFGINDAHTVVGQSQINDGGWTAGYPHAFYKVLGAAMVDLGKLSGSLSGAAYDINNNGLIVGRSQFSGGWYSYSAWVGVAGFDGLVDLNVVTDMDVYPDLTDAYSVNDRDVIVGVRKYDSGTSELHGVLLLPNE
jgi:probable HAF family extracellular repeat protein